MYTNWRIKFKNCVHCYEICHTNKICLQKLTSQSRSPLGQAPELTHKYYRGLYHKTYYGHNKFNDTGPRLERLGRDKIACLAVAEKKV